MNTRCDFEDNFEEVNMRILKMRNMKVSRHNALSRDELPDCAFDSCIIVIGCENEAGLVFCREAEHRGAHGVLLLSSSEKQRGVLGASQVDVVPEDALARAFDEHAARDDVLVAVVGFRE